MATACMVCRLDQSSVVTGRGGTPEDPGDFTRITRLSGGFPSPGTVVLYSGLLAQWMVILGTSQMPWFHFCLWEIDVFSCTPQWCLEPQGHCSIYGEAKGAVGAGQPWLGFSTSSHESLDVLGGSLTLVLCSASIWCGRSQDQPWSPTLPWGQICPFGFPSCLRGVGLHLLEQAPRIPRTQQGKALACCLGLSSLDLAHTCC